MKVQFQFAGLGILLAFLTAFQARADVLEMQNGDRYSGKVLAVTATTVVLNSEILGKITVPRAKVTTLTISTGNVAPKAASAPAPIVVVNTNANANANLSAALQGLGANSASIQQIRQQLLAGSPEAADKYDEMVNGLLSGQINVNDLRRQAQDSAQKIRELKRELGPEADASLDAYLKILDDFVNESAASPSGNTR